jgi:hypothetical protein
MQLSVPNRCPRLALDKLRSVIEEGKANPVTARNSLLTSFEEELNKMNYNLSTAVAQVRWKLCCSLLTFQMQTVTFLMARFYVLDKPVRCLVLSYVACTFWQVMLHLLT